MSAVTVEVLSAQSCHDNPDEAAGSVHGILQGVPFEVRDRTGVPRQNRAQGVSGSLSEP